MTRKLSPKDILKGVEKEGFEAIWQDSASFLPEPEEKKSITISERGASHPIFDLIQRMRQSFLDLGFIEVSNPMILDQNEIYKQYGPEAPIILDRCYYLATLPRPDIGLSRIKCQEIERFGIRLTEKRIDGLQRVLRDYRKGEVESDDLVEKLSDVLDVPDITAMLVISKVFPEFTSLRPEPTTLTLRSHITTAWFVTLQASHHKLELPVKLFTVDVRFRREQREDATHLRVHHAASCVLMDELVDVKFGEEITKVVLEPLGFKKLRFVKKKVTSKYYAPGMEYEGYIYHKGMNRWIEVVDYGLYSPIALARYDLDHPVLNLGIGIERVALALSGENDIRRLVYPQFYAELSLSDIEIAKMIAYEIEPKTKEGKELRDTIVSKAIQYADALGRCEFPIYEGKILDKQVRVFIYESEAGARLLGAAARNQIYVYDGNILGIPSEGMGDLELVNQAREKGIAAGISYLEGVASLAASRVEETTKTGRKSVNISVRIAKSPSDVNIKIGEVARRYVTSKRKKIEVKGPVFLDIRAEILG